MDIVELTSEQYANTVVDCMLPYNSAAFNLLNRKKTQELNFLIFKTKKNKLGLACGISSGVLNAPFSAPFACFEPLGKTISTKNYCEAISLLVEYAARKGCQAVQFILPPVFYGSDHINKISFSLAFAGFSAQRTDINFHMNLQKYFDDSYLKNVPTNTRRNLKIAYAAKLQFERCDNETSVQTAYEVIRRNRQEKGYPLHMSLTDLADTMKLICSDVFLVSYEGQAIAAAFVYCLTGTIAQLIYWGDIPGFEHVKPMNYLAYKLFHYYKRTGIHILDIGPSSSKGVPNYGLCDFKQSIGCEGQSKVSYFKSLTEDNGFEKY